MRAVGVATLNANSVKKQSINAKSEPFKCSGLAISRRRHNYAKIGVEYIYIYCCAQPGQTGLFTQSCCDLVVPWPHTGVSFQVLLPAGGIM